MYEYVYTKYVTRSFTQLHTDGMPADYARRVRIGVRVQYYAKYLVLCFFVSTSVALVGNARGWAGTLSPAYLRSQEAGGTGFSLVSTYVSYE